MRGLGAGRHWSLSRGLQQDSNMNKWIKSTNNFDTDQRLHVVVTDEPSIIYPLSAILKGIINDLTFWSLQQSDAGVAVMPGFLYLMLFTFSREGVKSASFIRVNVRSEDQSEANIQVMWSLWTNQKCQCRVWGPPMTHIKGCSSIQQ